MGTMSNVQFIILLTAILGGVVWQRVDYHQLSGRIDKLGDRVDKLSERLDKLSSDLSARIDRISDDLKHFYRELGRHDKAIESLERQRPQ